MAGGKHKYAAGLCIIPSPAFTECHAGYPPGAFLRRSIPQGYSRQLCIESDLAALPDDLVAHAFHNAGELISSHMRLALVSDLLVPAEFDKRVQNNKAPELPVLYAAVQFAVRKCPGAALTELYIAERIDRDFSFVECLYGFPAGPDILSLFDKYRSVTVYRQHVCTKKPGRPAADDIRPAGHLFSPLPGKDIFFNRCL